MQAELRVEDSRNKPGASLDFPDLYELAAGIHEALNDGCVGAVVTQGTDTIEAAGHHEDHPSGALPGTARAAVLGCDCPAPGFWAGCGLKLNAAGHAAGGLSLERAAPSHIAGPRCQPDRVPGASST